MELFINFWIFLFTDGADLTLDYDAEFEREEYTPKMIRCSCTMSVCVTTSYMCKSPSGACFTKPGTPLASHIRGRPPSRPNEPNLGCVELLPP